MNKEITCLYCKQPLYDLHAVSGRKYDPHWATADQDFGCDSNPISGNDGVGEHKVDWGKYEM